MGAMLAAQAIALKLGCVYPHNLCMSATTPFNFQPLLVGPSLSLRPLHADDVEALLTAACDPLIWAQHPDPLRYQRDAFKTRFFEPALAGGSALVVIDRSTQHIIGSSRYYDWSPDTREVAIGFTFLARSHWGGHANTEMKHLMLTHAFQWARTVWFHVGASNWRSRKAMEKIGAELACMRPKELNGQMHDYAYYKIDAPTDVVR